MTLIKFKGARIRKKKRTVSIAKGGHFFSAGKGKHGPYALLRKNIDRKTGIKVSAGTRGVEVHGDRITKNIRIGGGYNIITQKLYGELKYRKKRIRF